jgi:hypothetical protein
MFRNAVDILRNPAYLSALTPFIGLISLNYQAKALTQNIMQNILVYQVEGKTLAVIDGELFAKVQPSSVTTLTVGPSIESSSILDLVRPDTTVKYKRLSAETKQLIIGDIDEGVLSSQQIVAKYEISLPTFYNIRSDYRKQLRAAAEAANIN